MFRTTEFISKANKVHEHSITTHHSCWIIVSSVVTVTKSRPLHCTQKILRLLLKLEAHYRIHKIP